MHAGMYSAVDWCILDSVKKKEMLCSYCSFQVLSSYNWALIRVRWIACPPTTLAAPREGRWAGRGLERVQGPPSEPLLRTSCHWDPWRRGPSLTFTAEGHRAQDCLWVTGGQVCGIPHPCSSCQWQCRGGMPHQCWGVWAHDWTIHFFISFYFIISKRN